MIVRKSDQVFPWMAEICASDFGFLYVLATNDTMCLAASMPFETRWSSSAKAIQAYTKRAKQSKRNAVLFHQRACLALLFKRLRSQFYRQKTTFENFESKQLDSLDCFMGRKRAIVRATILVVLALSCSMYFIISSYGMFESSLSSKLSS